MGGRKEGRKGVRMYGNTMEHGKVRNEDGNGNGMKGDIQITKHT